MSDIASADTARSGAPRSHCQPAPPVAQWAGTWHLGLTQLLDMSMSPGPTGSLPTGNDPRSHNFMYDVDWKHGGFQAILMKKERKCKAYTVKFASARPSLLDLSYFRFLPKDVRPLKMTGRVWSFRKSNSHTVFCHFTILFALICAKKVKNKLTILLKIAHLQFFKDSILK